MHSITMASLELHGEVRKLNMPAPTPLQVMRLANAAASTSYRPHRQPLTPTRAARQRGHLAKLVCDFSTARYVSPLLYHILSKGQPKLVALSDGHIGFHLDAKGYHGAHSTSVVAPMAPRAPPKLKVAFRLITLDVLFPSRVALGRIVPMGRALWGSGTRERPACSASAVV